MVVDAYNSDSQDTGKRGQSGNRDLVSKSQTTREKQGMGIIGGRRDVEEFFPYARVINAVGGPISNSMRSKHKVRIKKRGLKGSSLDWSLDSSLLVMVAGYFHGNSVGL